jgi:hypothetical protein
MGLIELTASTVSQPKRTSSQAGARDGIHD